MDDDVPRGTFTLSHILCSTWNNALKDMNADFSISGNIVDIVQRCIFPGRINVCDGVIVSIDALPEVQDCFLVPGLVDAHVHIESSLLPPSEYAKESIKQGVMAAVADPHEIANVSGISGVKYMVDNAAGIPFYFKFGAPSCVPATNLETSGATISATDIENLFADGLCSHLSEMMNFPGVISRENAVLQKISVAKQYGLNIDGHAPMLSGEGLKAYVGAGISTDHECISIDEAIEKIDLGMKILIREGSAAKNLDALKSLVKSHANDVMLCSDDTHADNIKNGYLKNSVSKLIQEGFDIFDVLQCSTLNAANHYNIPIGMLQVGDNADFVVLDSLNEYNPVSVYFQGTNIRKFEYNLTVAIINNFNASTIEIEDINVKSKSENIRCIGILNNEIVTESLIVNVRNTEGSIVSDVDSDILKIVVLNRYEKSAPAVGFVKGLGLKKGAIATSISHDSHNIVAIGVSDEDIVEAINVVIRAKGGICYSDDNEFIMLELPIAGLMSDKGIDYVAEKYKLIEDTVKNNGSKIHSPLMNLSFLSLLVIPSLKISDRGLFDFTTFSYVDLFI